MKKYKYKQFGVYSASGWYVGSILADRAESGGYNHFLVYRDDKLIAILDDVREVDLPAEAICDERIKAAESTSAADSRAATKE